MNNGVGFLLRVTDVEKQPFRSMGFVSVGDAPGTGGTYFFRFFFCFVFNSCFSRT